MRRGVAAEGHPSGVERTDRRPVHEGHRLRPDAGVPGVRPPTRSVTTKSVAENHSGAARPGVPRSPRSRRRSDQHAAPRQGLAALAGRAPLASSRRGSRRRAGAQLLVELLGVTHHRRCASSGHRCDPVVRQHRQRGGLASGRRRSPPCPARAEPRGDLRSRHASWTGSHARATASRRRPSGRRAGAPALDAVHRRRQLDVEDEARRRRRPPVRWRRRVHAPVEARAAGRPRRRWRAR